MLCFYSLFISLTPWVEKDGLTPRQVWKFGGGDGKEFSQTWFEGIKTVKTDKETSLKALAQYLKISDRNILENSSEMYRPAYRVWR